MIPIVKRPCCPYDVPGPLLQFGGGHRIREQRHGNGAFSMRHASGYGPGDFARCPKPSPDLRTCGEKTTGQSKSRGAYLSSIDAVVNSEVDGETGFLVRTA